MATKRRRSRSHRSRKNRRKHSIHKKRRLGGMQRNSSAKNSSKGKYYSTTRKIIKGDFDLDKKTRKQLRREINNTFKAPRNATALIMGQPIQRRGRELLNLLTNKERKMNSADRSQ
jgi:hypothetical protein